MVKLLLRKMLRDIRRSGMTYLLCILIVSVGFCGYSVLSICADRLILSRDLFFAKTSFADVFAEVHGAPVSLEDRLGQISGILRVEGRLTETVRVAASPETEELKLISFRTGGLNLPLLSKGMLPAGTGANESVLGDGYFAAHHLRLGDREDVLINGRRVSLTAAGSGISPENIYMVKTITDLLPDAAKYDAAFLRYDDLAVLLGKDKLANEFVMTLQPGVKLDDVKGQIELMLKPYGLYTVYDRSGQLSASMLQSELDQIGRMASAIPFLFLGVAAVILYITLYRLVEQQRIQAGTLLAMGLDTPAVSVHYLGYGLFVGFWGGLLGGIAGNLTADPLYQYYRTYFSLPNIAAAWSVQYLVMGVVISSGFCALVGWVCARSLGQLQPADALRPAAPATARRSFLERIPRFLSLLTVPGIMAVRSLSRNRRRSFVSLCGIACAYMITASLVSMYSLYDIFIFDDLEQTQRQDVLVSFSQPVSADDALRAVRDPAIELTEGIAEFPVTLRSSKDQIDSTVQAIPEHSQLLRLHDESGRQVFPQPDGIILSRHVADLLGVHRGDTVEMEVTYPQKRISRVTVTDIAAQYLGSAAYMSYAGAGRVSDYRGVYTSVLLKAPEDVRDRILARLRDASAVAGVQTRMDRLNMYHSMMGNVNSTMATMATMGVLIGLAVIYVSSLIGFEELKREVSTMMMLGLESRQCLTVISTSQWLLTLGGILVGIPLTMGVGRLMNTTLASDLYSIPDFVDGRSLLLAAVLTLAAVAISAEIIHRKLIKLSPVELLRERE